MDRHKFIKWENDVLAYIQNNQEDPTVKLIFELFSRKFKTDKYFVQSLDQKYVFPYKLADLILEAYEDADDFSLNPENGLKLVYFAFLVIHCVDVTIYEIENKLKLNDFKFNVPQVYFQSNDFSLAADMTSLEDLSGIEFPLYLVHPKSNGHLSEKINIFWENYSNNNPNIENIDNYSNMLDVPIEVRYTNNGRTLLEYIRLADLPNIIKTVIYGLVEDFNKS